MQRIAVLLAASLLLGLVATGCSDDSTTPEGTGRLVLHLTDAPAPFDAVTLEVIRVSAHRSDEDSLDGWYVVREDTMVVDLLTLSNGVTELLADHELPAGSYDQVRLLLGHANEVVVDSVAHPLFVPSGMASGLKIQHDFQVVTDATHEALIDFDASRSVHQNGMGEYILNPVVRMRAVGTFGSIRGVVQPVEASAVVWTVAGADTVMTYADPLSGVFRLVMLPAGTYDVLVEPTEGAFRSAAVPEVAVQVQQQTDVGTVMLPVVP